MAEVKISVTIDGEETKVGTSEELTMESVAFLSGVVSGKLIEAYNEEQRERNEELERQEVEAALAEAEVINQERSERAGTEPTA